MAEQPLFSKGAIDYRWVHARGMWKQIPCHHRRWITRSTAEKIVGGADKLVQLMHDSWLSCAGFLCEIEGGGWLFRSTQESFMVVFIAYFSADEIACQRLFQELEEKICAGGILLRPTKTQAAA